MTPAGLDAAAAVVLSWLLTYAVHSTMLLVAAAIAAWRLADRHAWLDRIWKTAVIAPLLTATLPIDAVTSPLSGRWAIPTVTVVTEAPAPASAPAPAVRDVERTHNPAAPATESRVAARGAVLKWTSIAAAAWLLIAVAGVARYGARLRRVYAALGSGLPITHAELLEAIDVLRRSANERRSIRLTTNAHCRVPLAFGRHVVVPERFLHELDAEQQRAALAHEVAHVARRDPAWRVVVEILERALFFQPLNRLARVRLCDSAEFLCDEWAVRQTQSPLALARSLSVVASWWSPSGTLPVGASAMARSESAMVRRVTRILSEPAHVSRGLGLYWLAIPAVLVAVAAPRVTAARLPVAALVAPDVNPVVTTTHADALGEPPAAPSQGTPAEIAAARAQLRDYRSARSGGSLEDRWRQALADAGKERLSDFWIVYAFTTPTHAGDLMLSDTHEGSFVSSNGRHVTRGVPLAALLNLQAVPLEGSHLAVLMHYRVARTDAIDRAGYRSLQLGIDFGRAPVFWLGEAPEAESFARVRDMFGQARTEKIQTLLIELASLHSNTDVVAPFLTGLLDPSRPVAIRREAAEGFDHHHDPRSVEILLRVARTDPDSSVRAEAAETIGEVQTPQSIPALLDLVRASPDPDVRREAAEAFGEQPAARAVPAIESVIATIDDDDVLGEAIEALGEIGGAAVLPLLVKTANTHPNARAQQEAVETLGEIDEPGVVDALTRIAWEHRDVAIQREAVETLGDRHDDAAAMAALERIAREHPREEVQAEAIETIADQSEQALHPLILELAVSGRTAHARREAVDAIGKAVGKIRDPQVLDRAQAIVERVIFEDPDPAVRVDALDALDELPDGRALRALRDVIARHPDARVRREAEEHVRERK
jgi:HEAT repeat protein/beta-lactamase regulating signal transducer with metallopeptidase domain